MSGTSQVLRDCQDCTVYSINFCDSDRGRGWWTDVQACDIVCVDDATLVKEWLVGCEDVNMRSIKAAASSTFARTYLAICLCQSHQSLLDGVCLSKRRSLRSHKGGDVKFSSRSRPFFSLIWPSDEGKIHAEL